MYSLILISHKLLPNIVYYFVETVVIVCVLNINLAVAPNAAR